jgi:UDP-N-acetylmuramoyl-L-alanine---L-glutamate ligase
MRFDQPVLLYGAGREARSTAAFIKARSPETKLFVTVDSGEADLDGAEPIQPDDLPEAIRQNRFGLIVKSPGVSRYRPIFLMAREAGIPVTSNLNLWADAYRDGRTVIAISGTKGKSTTATLLHLMLVESGLDAGLAGNVGLAPLEIADRHSLVVFELSSYQTADMAFTPDLAAITNLYPEHVDWHRTVEHYYADKLNLIERERDFPVGLGAGARTNALVLSAVGNPDRILSDIPPFLEDRIVTAVRRSRLKGSHNLDNALLAAQLALKAGADIEGIIRGIAAFKPLPHRLEEHEVGSIVFVDDSISTTPEATKAALAAYKGRKIALIAGGHERNQDYTDLASRLGTSGVSILVCLPVTGDRLATATYAAAPEIEVLETGDLQAAMRALSTRRARFDTVILSPGAPSYNQFKNFEERGDRFIALARQLFA